MLFLMKHFLFFCILASFDLSAQFAVEPAVFFQQKYMDQQRILAQNTSADGLLKDSIRFLAWLQPLEKMAQEKGDNAILIDLRCAAARFWHAHGQPDKAKSILLSAIDLAKLRRLHLAEANASYTLGALSLQAVNYKEAVKHLLESINLFEEIGWDKVYDPSEKLLKTGEMMQQLYKNDLGMTYFKQAGAFVKDSLAKEHFKLFLLTGWSYRVQKDTANTKRCFDQCLKIGKYHNDQDLVAAASGEIGAEYFIQKRYDLAEPFMIADYESSIRMGKLASASNALGALALLDAMRGNKEGAIEKVRESERLCTVASDADRAFYNCEVGARVYVDIYKLLGDSATANHYQAQFARLMEGKKIFRNDSLRLIEVEAKAEAERLLRQFKALNETRNTELRNRNFGLAALGLGIFASLFILFRERKRRIQDRRSFKEHEEHLLEEQRHTSEELARARQALAEFTQRVRGRNSSAEEASEDEEAGHSVEEQLAELTILTDAEWSEFKRLFEQAHPCFFAKLESRYPGLTPAENRLLALTKLDIPQRDMGAMRVIEGA
jgi:hypothetical protein